MTTSCLGTGDGPAAPEQHIAPPIDDERFNELTRQRDAAITPWEKRRVERDMERLSVRYTEEMYQQDSRKLEAEADAIIEQAKTRMAEGAPPDKVYREAKRALTRLQESSDRSWKGHGPEILAPSLEKLEKIF